MSDSKIFNAVPAFSNIKPFSSEIRTELFRKCIHLMVAFVPLAASVNLFATKSFLVAAIVVYSVCEAMRLNGRRVLLISGITDAASRTRDKGHFVLGPVALAVGTLLALMLYPSTAAAVGIYALAFGDSAASIVGKFFGRIKYPEILGKKTLEGTLACFVAVFIVTFAIGADIKAAFIIAAIAAVTELVPIKDLDNLLIPVFTGMVAMLLL
ncbi:MAG: phosphatidate cytidylyltransferase [Spirochaetales bacterium]|nr:phosphatidate cytidylyltransferase [Spirochaetales bacterium]